MGLFGRYITAEGMHELKNYKYVSGEATLFDKLLNHWWDFAVKFLPLWIAPNLLTLLGFFCANGAFILALAYNPSLTEEAPTWVYLTIAFLLFMYQTLDAIDGKQARRTQTSSPLGQLFDHGCDIMIATTVAIMALAITCAGSGFKQYAVIVISAQVRQFIYMWWEYHFHVFYSSTGAFGVTEAQLSIMLMSLTSAAVGPFVFQFDLLDWLPSFFKDIITSIPFLPTKLRFIDLFIWWLIILNVSIAFYDILYGIITAKQKLFAAAQVGCFALFVYLQWIFYKTCFLGDIYVSSFLVYFVMTSAYSILLLKLCIASTCRMKHSLIEWSLLPFVILSLLLNTTFKFNFSVEILILIVSAWHLLYLSDFLITSVTGLCQFLNVNCFTVSKKVFKKNV